MTEAFLQPSLAALLSTMDSIDAPMFLVLVDGNDILFGGVNAAHTAATGIETPMVAGKTPFEAFPARLAETIDANYRRCLDAGQPYSYDELLELPKGARWWRTSLTPVREGNRVTAILGAATDITGLKSQIENVQADAKVLRKKAARVHTAATAAVSHMRGPLNNIVSLGQMLRAEFRPPMERKELLLELLLETAIHALDEIDTLEYGGGGLSALTGIEAQVDIGHICRDIAALIDPDRSLNVSFPNRMMLGNPDAVQTVLQAAFTHAASEAVSLVALTLGASPQRAGAVIISLDWDLPRVPRSCTKIEERGEHSRPIDWLRASVDAHGGQMNIGFSDESQTGMQLDIRLPETVLSTAPVGPSGLLPNSLEGYSVSRD
ncbi:MAG: PAS domain-containing protein [Rhodobacteraceae bacterium]|nr:PAS domain-containing protein [Paracoccaceae bacterium]